jgi:sigma-B regulation protein RsbU (phosphoserine phosphatase)
VSAEQQSELLQSLLSVTDVSLSRLDVEDLLVQLLEPIRVALAADTAAVLLREEGSPDLIARATCGLEEEVRQGVRIPLGVGFAGQVATGRKPVFLNHVDETTVVNPILWEKGIRTMLGVPLILEGARAGSREDVVIGVLHVGRLSDRPFVESDAELLQIAAQRVAVATQLRRLAVESAAARLLEHSLQPSRLPVLPGLEFAGRYVPADNRTIGGDWYDAFIAPSDRLWLVTGDVAGHGLNAAVVMGRVKSALRAYALHEARPERVLELTDQKIQHFEIGTMVTVVCAVADPPYHEFRIASAGHLPPVLAAPDRDSVLVDTDIGPPLGVMADIRRRARTIDLPLGGLLLLYTDGLVERRSEVIDEGLERLRAAVSTNTPELVCQTVMRTMVGREESSSDDTALLAVQRVEHGRAIQ